jgi:S1-C subfamily serine protease
MLYLGPNGWEDDEASPSPSRRAGVNLVRCVDCSRDVSKRAHMCPHCGCPSPAGSSTACRVIAGVLVAVLAVGAVALVCHKSGARLAPPRCGSIEPADPDPEWSKALESRPRGAGYLGVILADRAGGAVVTFLGPDSPAREAGVRPGDRIALFEGEEVRSFHDVLDRLWKKSPGDAVSLTVVRAEASSTHTTTVQVTLGTHPRDR